MERYAQGKRRANRQYKNNLFVYLFTRKKKYALSLYNAINCTDYTNEEDLEFKVLEDVLFVRMRFWCRMRPAGLNGRLRL